MAVIQDLYDDLKELYEATADAIADFDLSDYSTQFAALNTAITNFKDTFNQVLEDENT